MTQKFVILQTLKKLLSESNLTYSKLGKLLKLSEPTVKRILNGKTTLGIERLEEILKILGVDFLQFAQLIAMDTDAELKQLTLSQERILSNNEKLLAFFYLLLRGYSIKQISQRYHFSEKEAFTMALSLEKAKLIEVHPNNRIKILVSRFVQWRTGGPLELKFRTANQAHFINNAFTGPNEIFRFISVLLPEKSISEFNERFLRLFDEIRENSSLREARNPTSNRPYTLLLAGREYIPEFIKKYSKGNEYT